ncbi:MAG: PIN domain-containing protein [Candidatus Bathyarchaeia archaeon]
MGRTTFAWSQKDSLLGESFLQLPNLKLLKAEIGIILRAQSLLEKCALKPRSSIHAAAAPVNKIEKILSYDKDFDVIPNLFRTTP